MSAAAGCGTRSIGSRLNRKIVLYAADGSILREWETTAKVEDKGGTCYFINAEGKAVTISGTFVIEEK